MSLKIVVSPVRFRPSPPRARGARRLSGVHKTCVGRSAMACDGTLPRLEGPQPQPPAAGRYGPRPERSCSYWTRSRTTRDA